jgi:hypothetical protein
MDSKTFQDLMRTYQEMYQVDEEVKKLRRREMRKGEGINNYSGRGTTQKKTAQTGTDTGKSTGGEGKAFAGKGRFANNTTWTGAGAQKSTQNNPKADDKRASDYKKNLAKDKASERGISPEERKERARKNKEKKAKAGIDALLKDIRKKK